MSAEDIRKRRKTPEEMSTMVVGGGGKTKTPNRNVSYSNRSRVSPSSSSTGLANGRYAGAKFSESPPATFLPPPPAHWISPGSSPNLSTPKSKPKTVNTAKVYRREMEILAFNIPIPVRTGLYSGAPGDAQVAGCSS